jgi:hypothetical protein
MTDATHKLAIGNVRDALAGIAAVATLLTTEQRALVDRDALLRMIAQTAKCADHLLQQIERSASTP